MARTCPNCGQVTLEVFRQRLGARATATAYVCSNCGQRYDSTRDLADATQQSGQQRRERQRVRDAGTAETLARIEERRRRDEEHTREREWAEEEQRRRRERAHGEALAEEALRRPGYLQPTTELPGERRPTTRIVVESISWFVAGIVLAALLGSIWLFLAFVCWTANSVIRAPHDPIQNRIEQIRNRYRRLLNRQQTPAARQQTMQNYRADVDIEAVMRRIEIEANPEEVAHMRNQWQRTLKSSLNMFAFALLVLGIYNTTLPMSGLVALIVSFIAYFSLRRL